MAHRGSPGGANPSSSPADCRYRPGLVNHENDSYARVGATWRQTRCGDENVYIDVDADGNLVSMTVEHAKSSGALSELVYRDMGRQSA